jgi:hypothetical protein
MVVGSIQQGDKWKKRLVSTGLTGDASAALVLALTLISTIGALILAYGM